MPTAAKSLMLIALVFVALFGSRREPSHRSRPAYLADTRLAYAGGTKLIFPAQYRNWTFLTSGIDMSYTRAAMQMGGQHMFDNVFVNPEAYREFVHTGTWPDKTELVLEVRAGQTRGSINRHGNFQTRLLGLEVHVRDQARFAGNWGFFAFDPGGKISPMIPPGASCYACHSAHGAVDSTFVQFYPTLLPIAASKGTLSHAYENETKRR